MPRYTGPERRIRSDDHDTLIEMVQMQLSHVKHFDSYIERFEKHIEDDDKNFKFLNKMIFTGLGIVITLQVLIPIVVAIKFH